MQENHLTMKNRLAPWTICTRCSTLWLKLSESWGSNEPILLFFLITYNWGFFLVSIIILYIIYIHWLMISNYHSSFPILDEFQEFLVLFIRLPEFLFLVKRSQGLTHRHIQALWVLALVLVIILLIFYRHLLFEGHPYSPWGRTRYRWSHTRNTLKRLI